MPEFKPAPVKPEIEIGDVDKLDVRVGRILTVEDVQDAYKLVQLEVDFGDHRRRILAGIKEEREDVQEVVGRQALFIINLKPRKMRGVLSEGMLFDLGYEDGITPVLAVPETRVPEGTRAG